MQLHLLHHSGVSTPWHVTARLHQVVCLGESLVKRHCAEDTPAACPMAASFALYMLHGRTGLGTDVRLH